MFLLDLALCVLGFTLPFSVADCGPNAQKVAGFPTIKFRAAGSNEWVDYEGDRSVSHFFSIARNSLRLCCQLDSFIEYIESNAKNNVHPDSNSTTEAEKEINGDEHHKRDEL